MRQSPSCTSLRHWLRPAGHHEGRNVVTKTDDGRPEIFLAPAMTLVRSALLTGRVCLRSGRGAWRFIAIGTHARRGIARLLRSGNVMPGTVTPGAVMPGAVM